MTLAVLVIVSASTVLLLLLYGATVELYRQVLQLRMHAGLTDETQPLGFNRDSRLSDLPVPATTAAATAVGGHDGDGRQAVLILSDSCSTCGDVARGLGREPAPGLVVLVESRSGAAATAWLRAQGLAPGDRVIYDRAGRMADRLGVAVTPSVVRFEGDRATAASTVPSRRQLDAVLAWLRHADARLPTAAR